MWRAPMFQFQAAIASAKTLEEVERIHRMLQLGQLPGVDDVKQNGTQPGQ